MDPIDDIGAKVTSARAALQKEKTDIYNRLHSIQEDAQFVSRVSATYPRYPIVANQRCGVWYCDPSVASKEYAYFKSTDGHFGQWDFNLRRANLHLLSLIETSHGLILVDSTRKGKRLPDALSKTVPIWCAVINRVLARRGYANQEPKTPLQPDCNMELFTPPGIISGSEHSQIEGYLDTWANRLAASTFTLPKLTKPLRPIWITPSSALSSISSLDLKFFPILCVSASRPVADGLERRMGYSYVQGSGDDHELWAQGLTPSRFWTHRSDLLACSRNDLATLVASLVSRSDEGSLEAGSYDIYSVSTVNGLILVGALAPSTTTGTDLKSSFAVDAAVIFMAGDSFSRDDGVDSILRLQAPQERSGPRIFVSTLLPRAMEYVHIRLNRGERVLIACERGDDRAQDASLGLAMAVLQRCFNDDGQLCQVNDIATKSSIRRRLEWIQKNHPRANPSRNVMKRINEYFLSNIFSPEAPT